VSTPRLSPPAFTVAFSCTYAVVFVMNWPLFLYYPLHGALVWGWHPISSIGPPIVWYGFMTEATVAGLLGAVCVAPDAVGRLRNRFWLFPLAAMWTCVYVLRRLFL